MRSRFKIILFIITLFGIMCITTKVNAASASISASKTSATTGDSVSINVYVNAAAWNLRVSGNGISGDSIVGFDSDGNNTSTSRSFTLNTSSAGTYTIYLSGDVTDGATDATSSINTSVTVTVAAKSNPSSGGGSSSSGGGSSSSSSSSGGTSSKPNTTNNKPTTTNNEKPKEEEKKSNDATLKALVVEGFDLYPEFSSDTLEYNIKVPNDITEVNIVPTVNDSKASANIEGTYSELQVGENIVKIVVTAEDGTIREYVIRINRAREALKVTNIILFYIDEEGNNKELVLTPSFDPEVYEYNLDNLSYLVSKLEMDILTNLEEAVIEITGNDELVEGENLITITVKVPSEGEEEDEVLTYKIIVNKEKAPKLTIIGKIKNWFNGITGTISAWYSNNQYNIMLSALALCSATMGGLTVYLVNDYKKYKNLLEKLAQVTKLNNSNEVAVETTNIETSIVNEENETIEEIDNIELEEKTAKSKGRHF